MSFNESNTIEAYVRDLLAGPIKALSPNTIQEPPASYGPNPKGIGWHYAAPADVPRQIQDVLVEPWLREALLRLNPEIAAQPDRADEVQYKLRVIVLSVRADGLIRANEEMTAWMRAANVPCPSIRTTRARDRGRLHFAGRAAGAANTALPCGGQEPSRQTFHSEEIRPC